MKTLKRRRKYNLGVDNPFFPRARKAEERLRAQEGAGEAKKRIWEYIPGETPPGGTPPVEHPELMRPGFQPSYMQEPTPWPDAPAMWAIVDEARRTPGYASQPVLVQVLTRPVKDQDHAIGEIAEFFGIPVAAFQGLSIGQAWRQVIGPMIEEFELIMNRGRPTYITGSLRFDFSPHNELIVVYYDR